VRDRSADGPGREWRKLDVKDSDGGQYRERLRSLGVLWIKTKITSKNGKVYLTGLAP
jgi:hypothetical protein